VENKDEKMEKHVIDASSSQKQRFKKKNMIRDFFF